jgi:hypothetical protein
MDAAQASPVSAWMAVSREQNDHPLVAPFYDGVCQEGGPAGVERAPALAGVNVVRPVGR